MTSNGSIDTAAAAKLPTVNGTPVFLTRAAGDGRRDLRRRELDQGDLLIERGHVARWGPPASRSRGGRRPGRAIAGSRSPGWARVPFFAYVGVFLLLPTGIVRRGARSSNGGSFDFGA